jgi:hypothetical protein
VILLLGICVFIGALGGMEKGKNDIRQEAIKLGVAEYVIVNKETGATEFRFKEVK